MRGETTVSIKKTSCLSSPPKGYVRLPHRWAVRFRQRRLFIWAILIGITLLTLVACSQPASRVIALGDLLGVDKRTLILELTDEPQISNKWQLRSWMPLVAPSLESLRLLEVLVDADRFWIANISHENAPLLDDEEYYAAMPPNIHISDVTWSFTISSGEHAIEVTTLIPTGLTLNLLTCLAVYCYYESTASKNSLGFTVSNTELPAIPASWPRPLSQVLVDVELSMEVHPEYPDLESGATPTPFDLTTTLHSGNSTIRLEQR